MEKNGKPMLQLGWKAGPEQYPATELCDYAVVAEQAGFDSIDVSDHFHPWSEVGQAAFLERYGRDVLPALRR
jgi:coenzyme F420-dependent glucose-6-phosphate dehydrogenase